VAGTVAQNNTVVVIDDAYALRDGPIHHDHRFDVRFGYHTRSIVGIPLATRDGEGLRPPAHQSEAASWYPLLDPQTAARFCLSTLT
jgi:hypothetical protein